MYTCSYLHLNFWERTTRSKPRLTIEDKAEGTAFTKGALYVYFAALGIDELFGDGKAQTGTGLYLTIWHFKITIKNLQEIFFFDTYSKVLHSETYSFFIWSCT